MRGHDLYKAECDIYEVMAYVMQHRITIYHLREEKYVYFSSSCKYRTLLQKHPLIHYQSSIGMMGMVFRFFASKEKIAALICSLLLFLGLSKTIFQVEILGESDFHHDLIETKLKQFQTPFFYWDSTSIYKKLAELNQDLNWYAVHQKGSKLEIHFLPREKMELSQFHPYDLIASKDGVIAAFDVAKGNKVVKINQKVQKGEILVSHIILDSKEEEKTSDVLGKVYAYTFERIDMEISKNELPEAINYYLCLMKSRMQLSLDKDEYIVKEIPLQFEEDSATIRMSNYYVLYEMIAVVGESDE